ncbi:MAG: CHASE domain-containing protein [Candidatus Omnitrophica bacterium]|nr:CHASE domain-containing protein [Candidatus Omnitrophota bacterium]
MKNFFYKNITVCAVYYILGKLALLIAIPPGYATAIWPAAGAALAMMIQWGNGIWPGIWLGSFLMNVSTGLGAHSETSWLITLVVPAMIGSGAVLEALIGKTLLRRFLKHPYDLISWQDILRFVFWGSVVACVINPTIGCYVLQTNSFIPPNRFVDHWFVWWLGDAVGVMIFTPLVLAFIGTPRKVWRSRRLALGISLSLACISLTVIFLFIHQAELKRIRTQAVHQKDEVSHAFKQSIRSYEDILYSIKSFYDSSQYVDRNEFRTYVHFIFQRYRGVYALEWVPEIKKADVETLIKKAHDDGLEHFALKSINTSAGLDARGQEAVYYPVFYAEPLEQNKAVLGLDNGSNQQRLKAYLTSKQTSLPVVTEPLQLVQIGKRSDAFLMYLAVYKDKFLGCIAGVFRMEDIIAEVKQTIALTDKKDTLEWLRLEINDITDGDVQTIFSDPFFDKIPVSYELQETILVGARQWQLRYLFSKDYITKQYQAHGLYMVMGGLLSISVLVILILTLTGQSISIKNQVIEKTIELSSTNNRLEIEILNREKLVDELTLQTHRYKKQRTATISVLKDLEEERKKMIEQERLLRESNLELEQFAYVASHDLQEPLRKVISYAQLFEKKMQGKLDEMTSRYLFYMVDGATRMQGLIRDLLSYSRVSRGELETESTDMNEVVQIILHDFEMRIQKTGAQIHYGILPKINANKRQMGQVFQNLIGNALKYHDERTPEINISFEEHPREWLFCIKDNGIGIDAQYSERVFVIFQRLHTRQQYSGTGIGLAICKKIVERHDGRIWLESELGKGSAFFFTIAKALHEEL